jgi:hypothetical protein
MLLARHVKTTACWNVHEYNFLSTGIWRRAHGAGSKIMSRLVDIRLLVWLSRGDGDVARQCNRRGDEGSGEGRLRGGMGDSTGNVRCGTVISHFEER